MKKLTLAAVLCLFSVGSFAATGSGTGGAKKPATNPVIIIRHGWADGFWRLVTNPMIIIKT